jgi:predicted DNA-binding protein (MmcQ/YjbR family)
MTKTEFFDFCRLSFGTNPDYPFDEDIETAVMRHRDNKKWYAIVMRVSRRKLGIDSDELVDVVNTKLPPEMMGSFTASDGVYPAYHMNKMHWVSIILPDAESDIVTFLATVSFEATKSKNHKIQKS